MFWLSLAFAGSSLSIDLDGDGRPETVSYDATRGKVRIGPHTVDCDGDPCDLEAHDITSANKQREVEVCAHGPRDDAMCTLYSLSEGKLVTYEYPREWAAPDLRTSGNGLVLVVDGYRLRLYERIEKFKVEGTKLVEVRQPIYSAKTPRALKVERTFPLMYGPTSKEVVANTRPGSTIQILGEHGESEGWLLIRLSSGITGWASADTLQSVSIEYMQIMGAG